MAKPVCSQTMMTIRKKLFQGGTVSQGLRCTTQGNHNCIQQADLLDANRFSGISVNKLPDHACAHE